MDEEIEREEYLKELRELEEEMENVLNDKRFEFITQDGKKIYTHDKKRYDELKSQREELIKRYKNQELKNTIQKEIDDLERAKKNEVDREKRRIEDLRRLNDRRVRDLENAKDDIVRINNDEALSFENKIKTISEQLNVDIENRKSYIEQLKELSEEVSEIPFDPQVPGDGNGQPAPSSDPDLERVQQLAKADGGQWVYVNKDLYGKMVYWSGDVVKFAGGAGGVFQMSADQYRSLPEIDGVKVMRDYKPPSGTNPNPNPNTPPPSNEDSKPPTSTKSWHANWIDEKYLTEEQKEAKEYALTQWSASKIIADLLEKVKTRDDTQNIVDYAKSIGVALNYYHTGLDKGMFAGDIPFDPKTETIAKLLKGEIVMTKPQFDNIIPNIMKNMSFLNKNQAQPIKQYILNNPIIKANNPIELFSGIEHMVRSQG